ncbi:MAG: NAD-glutamate dehydrogenase [Alphaproteobacteria bacterium]|nr:NAD-glutamate dehydrogenase [Alphaproteobacteria bacterium]
MAPLQRKLDSVKQAAVGHDGPDAGSSDQFQAFVDGSLRQLRAPFLSRHAPADVVALLSQTLGQAREYSGDAPRVVHELRGSTLRLWTVMPDQPFIVDTCRLLLRTRQWEYICGFNIMIGVGRDADGALTGVGPSAGPLESWTFLEAEVPDPDAVPAAIAELEGNLRLAQATVGDFHAMTDFVDNMAHRFSRLADRMPDRASDLRESAEFLHWLLSDNFVFMGVVCGDSRFGVAAPGTAELWEIDSLVDWSVRTDAMPISVRKGRRESRVHRAGRVDEIRIEIPRTDDATPVLLYIQGLFTYRAVSQPSRHVPWLRRLLASILAGQETKPGSYRYKGIANVFDSLPTEFLFTAEEREIVEIIERVLESEVQQDARVQIVQSGHDDVTFALAAMPKDRWNDQLRESMQDVLRRTTGATYSDHGVFVGRFDTMLVHFYLTGSRRLADGELEALTEQLVELATPWGDRLFAAITEVDGGAAAAEVLFRYGEAFDEDYRRNTSTEQTLRDLALLERLSDDVALIADTFVDEGGRVNLRVYQQGDVLLSDMLPVLDDFGLIVIDQYANSVNAHARPLRTIDTFRLKGVWGISDDELLERAPDLIAGIEAVFARKVDDDLLNRILLRANIPWQAVDLVRAYLGYARQLGMRYTLVRFQELLLASPELVHNLWELFQARFDPDFDGARDKVWADLSERYLDRVRSIDDHDQDMVFRTLYNLVDSTLRTNFYRTDRVDWYISFKIQCSKVWNMPEPRMMYEIYVHHRVVEGVHLRGGPIARGGIRWSDRADFRREILDLVNTQMVKNVLIVPEGAKGGFFLKKTHSDPAERRRRADDMYEILVRGLLDLTDNLVGDQVVVPPRVVRLDGDDPYLVVAADKGTAHLSDRANSVSRAYGFWLDDAFASGGSNGYDHKGCGITARGAWRTVHRHFLEMGVDPYTEDFTCIGIGDCGGDVFGNGVIETPHLRLLAAFNHMHVFLDPDPDTAASFAERKRLFDAVKGWDHYDESIISKGGGIYSRRSKSIKLSPEAQKMLGTLKDELSVDAVIRLILRMDADLFWNGGIGTYIKASGETHQQAKDPTNDELRINADELRCRVVGEGGNLGFTPEARIEYALNGGRLNTDAIDNSGGVDMSDHEVNLKILLSAPVGRGELTTDARNELLEDLTEAVTQQVLANNDVHGRQLSLDQIRSQRDPMFFWPTIQWVCARSGRSTSELHLPSHDALRRRADGNQGLTRPELSVLQAHVKMHVFKDLMTEDPGLVPHFRELVLDYFAEDVRERFADDIGRHMLYKDIGMTVVCTQVVGDAGATYFPNLVELTGSSPARAAAAWFRGMDIVEAPKIRERVIATTDSKEARYQAWIATTDAVLKLVSTWLAPGEPDVTDAELDGLRAVLTRLPKIRGTAHIERLQARVNTFTAKGIDRTVASRLAALGELTLAREIALLNDGEERISSTIIRYLAIGEASRMLPAIRAIERRPTHDRWDPVAMGILRNRFIQRMRELFHVVPVGAEVRLGVDRLARRLARGGSGVLEPLQGEMDRILGKQADLATLLVAEERVRAWIAQNRGKIEA